MYSTRIRVTASLLARIYSNQLPSDADLGVITMKIATDLPIGRIAICPPEQSAAPPWDLCLSQMEPSAVFIISLRLNLAEASLSTLLSQRPILPSPTAP